MLQYMYFKSTMTTKGEEWILSIEKEKNQWSYRTNRKTPGQTILFMDIMFSEHSSINPQYFKLSQVGNKHTFEVWM